MASIRIQTYVSIEKYFVCVAIYKMNRQKSYVYETPLSHFDSRKTPINHILSVRYQDLYVETSDKCKKVSRKASLPKGVDPLAVRTNKNGRFQLIGRWDRCPTGYVERENKFCYPISTMVDKDPEYGMYSPKGIHDVNDHFRSNNLRINYTPMNNIGKQ